MSTGPVEAVVVALFALASGVLVAAWLRDRLGAAAIGLLVAAALTWALTLAAVITEYGDADGFATCTDSCSTVHYVSAVAFLAPPLLASLAALAMIVAVARRRRARIRATDGNRR